jgi:hypothetical protein
MGEAVGRVILGADIDVSLVSVISGDLVVHDALGTPTSKQQCRNGGWQSFPRFRNQGNCVSVVATGGRKARAD